VSGRGRRRPVRQQYAQQPYGDPYGQPYGDPYAPGYEDEWYEDEPPRRGRLVTPARFLLVLLLIGSGGVALYGVFFDRTRLQIPLTVSGLAVFGVCLALLALMFARGAASLGRRGSGGKAFLAALLGGVCALGAAGSLAGAVVLGILAAAP
jgi:hypothetical protein